MRDQTIFFSDNHCSSSFTGVSIVAISEKIYESDVIQNTFLKLKASSFFIFYFYKIQSEVHPIVGVIQKAV